MTHPTLTLRRWLYILISLTLLLIIAIGLGCALGSTPLNWQHIFAGTPSSDTDIFYLSRLPRVLLAVLVGVGLSSSGAAFQGLLRNPLADPFILGVSSGAALCSVIALACGVPLIWLPLLSFAGALVAMAGVYYLASFRRRLNSQVLLLTGVVFNAFAYAFILFINAVVPLEQSQRIFTMLIGSLNAVNYHELIITTGLVIIGLLGLQRSSRALNLLSENNLTAQSLGINPTQQMKLIFFFASLMVGAVVAQSGLVGFVGLFVPHIARKLWGPDHRILIPSAALIGAILLVCCDVLARTVGFYSDLQTQLPVGAVTALFGAPFFLVLLRQVRS